MPQITFDVPAGGQANRVLNAVCERNGYDPLIHGSKLDFLKAWTIRMWKNEAKSVEGQTALLTAREQVENDIQIT